MQARVAGGPGLSSELTLKPVVMEYVTIPSPRRGGLPDSLVRSQPRKRTIGVVANPTLSLTNFPLELLSAAAAAAKQLSAGMISWVFRQAPGCGKGRTESVYGLKLWYSFIS